jgi:hypothetical protein
MSGEELDIKQASNSLYDVLKPLRTADRQKALNSALALLGETFKVGGGASADSKNEDDEHTEHGSGDAPKLVPSAKRWANKYGVTREQLEHALHIEGEKVDVVLDHAPGKNDKERAINSYLLTGLAELLRTGEPKFTDRAARDLCRKLGSYDPNNHAVYLKKPGNILSGNKDSGWTLTGPGQKAAAELVKAASA